MLIPEERLPEETHIISQISSGHSVGHFDTWRRLKDGSFIPVSLSISPIRDSFGKVIGASKIARDISRQKQAEEQIRQNARNLELLNEVSKAISEKLDVKEIRQK